MTRLSAPLALRNLQLSNRLVMAPMVTGSAVDDRPSARTLAWYARHAASGVGLIVVEACPVAPDAKLLPFMMGVWEDGHIPGLRTLAEAIHAHGVPAVVQIVHGGARAWREDPRVDRVGPSRVACAAGPAPRPLEEHELQGIIAAFAAAAHRVQAAGFDGVELHAAHYYLLSEFLSPCTNRRTDAWGGSRENRGRLLKEVVQAVRREVGDAFPIFCRLHALERFEGGTPEEDLRAFAQMAIQAGVDVIDASGVGQAAWSDWEGTPFLNASSVLPKDAPAGAFLPATARMKAALGAPVIAVGRLGEPGLAARVLEHGEADLVALARQLIADPETPRKLLEGQEGAIHRCTDCLACFAAIRRGPLSCPVNPDLGSGQ